MDKDLNRVLDCKAEYNRMLDKIQELEALSQRVSAVINGMPKNRKPGSREELWARLADYKSDCELKILRYIEMSHELEDELDGLDGINARTAMKYKYLDGLTIEQIADKMAFSTRMVDRFLRDGRIQYRKL